MCEACNDNSCGLTGIGAHQPVPFHVWMNLPANRNILAYHELIHVLARHEHELEHGVGIADAPHGTMNPSIVRDSQVEDM